MLQNVEVECFIEKAWEPNFSFWYRNDLIFGEEVAVLEGDIPSHPKCQSYLILIREIVRQLIIVGKADDLHFPATFDYISKEYEADKNRYRTLIHL